MSNAVVGGKQVVITANLGYGFDGTTYWYASGDVLYLVVTEDSHLAAALLAALP